jgi:hypothetical protein
VAQEVGAVLPELVQSDNDGAKSVSYERLSVLLLEAVKAHQRQIQQLVAKSRQLERERDGARAAHSSLESRLEAIERRLAGTTIPTQE